MSEAEVTRIEVLRRGGVAAAALVAAPSVVAAMIRSQEAAAATAANETLTAALSGEPDTMDPHLATTYPFYNAVKFNVFDGLVAIDAKLRFVPRLATSWTASRDGKTWTFRLRKGVRFHDGAPFTASDVAFNVNRLKAKKTASPFEPNVASVARVQVVNPTTVVFHMKAPTPALLAQLLDIVFLSKKSLKDMAKSPVGTGPFSFTKWQRGDNITLTKNPSYYIRTQPKLTTFIAKTIPDAQVQISNISTGAVQVVAQVPATSAAQIRKLKNVRLVQSRPIVTYEMIQFNTSIAPFDSVRVRQAMSYLFDRKAYVRTAWEGLARPAVNPVPNEYASFLRGSDSRYAFNQDRAVALLTEAGYTSSNPLTFKIVNPSGFPTLSAASLQLQDRLNKLGHKVTVQNLEIAVWVDNFESPDFQASTNVYGFRGPDPVNLFNAQNFNPAANTSKWSPAGYGALVARAARELNTVKRNNLYRQIQTLVLNQVPLMVLSHGPAIAATTNDVRGFSISPTGFLDSWAVTSRA